MSAEPQSPIFVECPICGAKGRVIGTTASMETREKGKCKNLKFGSGGPDVLRPYCSDWTTAVIAAVSAST